MQRSPMRSANRRTKTLAHRADLATIRAIAYSRAGYATRKRQRRQRQERPGYGPSPSRRSETGQRRNQGAEPVREILRIAGDAYGLAPASGAGDDRQVAARQPQNPGQQLQQRFVGAPVLGRRGD